MRTKNKTNQVISKEKQMSNSTVQGVVHVVQPVETFGTKGFRKRVVVLEQDSGNFINYIPVEFTNDDCDRAEDIEPGSTIEVKYFLNGRKWQKDAQSDVKFFVSIRVADYRLLGNPEATTTEATPDVTTYDNADNADIPF